MPSLWFIVPAHGRLELAAICLAQLRRTCDQLTDYGIHAEVVVIACDENLDTARDLGFGTVERDNQFVSSRFNDGIQLACDPHYNPRPADYVVPCGSDDWVDWQLFVDLPPADRMIGFQAMSFVREDGRQLATRHVRYDGGCGIRILSRQMMAAVGYRPADEDRKQGCDTSILSNLRKAGALATIEHRATDPLQIVDWKTTGSNLHPYSEIVAKHRGETYRDPFRMLAQRFPAEALEEMRGYYNPVLVAA